MPKILTILFALLCTPALAQQKGTFTDTRDGKTYKTVKICEQVWMAENLNYNASGSRCYNDSTAYCNIYGRLYDWKTAKTVCPNGWHLPSRVERIALTEAVGGEKTEGKYLKSTSGWNDVEGESGNGEDKFGFSALPGGYYGNRAMRCDLPGGNCDFSDGFSRVGYFGVWWHSSEYGPKSESAYDMMIVHSSDYSHLNAYNKNTWYSVRCIQDTHPNKINANTNNPIQKGTITDTRDGKKYKTVKIGEQVWMAENLNYNTGSSKCYSEGDKIWEKNNVLVPVPPAKVQANCKKYGRLYNWETAMKACPEGWHLPSKMEWDILYRYADGTSLALQNDTSSLCPYESQTAYKHLKATSGWRYVGTWDEYRKKSGNGTDAYGFSALPGGYGYYNDYVGFGFEGTIGWWWSSTEYGSDKAHHRNIRFEHDDVDYVSYDEATKDLWFSVRCIQNTTTPPTGEAK